MPDPASPGQGHPAAAALRQEVGVFRAGERRRRFPLGVHVGVPAGHRESTRLPWPSPAWHDAALRSDVVGTLLERLPRDDPAPGRAHAWLTRPGVPETHDVDLAWLAAATSAFAARRVALDGFYVVTRTGWYDVVSGVGRVWARLRL